MNHPFRTGLAFGAGFLLAPGLIWLVLGLAAVIFIAVVTHWWVLPALAILFLGAVVYHIVKALKQQQVEDRRSLLDWVQAHVNEGHDPSKPYPGCPSCRYKLVR